jgi:hypothetical protein
MSGALALRASEQGTPLISRGLAPAGEALIGGPVPWIPAASTEDIVGRTTAVLDSMTRRGRDTVIAETRAGSRGWLLRRHSPEITAALQRELYARIVDGRPALGSMAPGRWAEMLHEGE